MTGIPPAKTPFITFQNWMAEAEGSEPDDPTAASLATVDEQGAPNVRVVLIRIMDERGFAFFTNGDSRKGRELGVNPQAALCFHWKSLRRQVRIRGRAEPVTQQEADEYYAARPRGNQIGAWASFQSEKLDSRETLLQRVSQYEKQFEGVDCPPRPPHWSGYRIVPTSIEFWQEGESRIHHRRIYERQADGTWTTSLLYP
jgi:pyridoxamine 5'-phosphate oxidase